MAYVPPVADMLFNLRHLCEATSASGATSIESTTEILDQASSFASEALAPLNRIGDRTGARMNSGEVVTPPGWKDAYAVYAAGGWIGAVIDPELGGMGLSSSLGACLQEILQGANMAFALCPMLSQAAIKAISLCGSADQKSRYLPKLISGEWTGTMVLTEPNAGSDLSQVRTRAERLGDHYSISGQKIFITYGDHDLTDNILHLVLARTAPGGTKGLSLFLVPKRHIGADGDSGHLNDVRCVSIEHKMGIHGSPTAVLSFGDNGSCRGELIGEEGRGLEYMFIMMNEARLSVGVQGMAVAERAYQLAAAFANERVQGRVVGDTGGAVRPISFHPDVHRMLMTMRSTCEAMRGLTLYTFHCMDLAHSDAPDMQRNIQQARVEFLVPIVKGWCTERACEMTSLGIQVHGGMGYIEETGAAQLFRDARITTIYEGTTGIQAGDLLSRKIRRDGGVAARAQLAEIRQFGDALAARREREFTAMRDALATGVAACEEAVRFVLSDVCGAARGVAVSVHVLQLFGLTIGGWIVARAALAAQAALDHGAEEREFLKSKIGTAHFFVGPIMPEVHSRLAMVLDETESALALYPAHL